MTTSGTAVWNPDLSDIIEEAYERCGIELRSGYDYRTARRSLNLIVADWANRGINLFTIEEGEIDLLQGVKTYSLPADTVDLVEHVIRQYPLTSGQADLTINRISVATYSTIPNKWNEGRPIQMWVNRQVNNPEVTVWPVPNTTGTYKLIYWRMRRIEDPGVPASNSMDIPFRFYEALISGLAFKLAIKRAPEKAQMLKAEYDEAFQLAADEDRDRAPLRIVPRMM